MKELLERHGLTKSTIAALPQEFLPELEAEERSSISQTDAIFTFELGGTKSQWKKRRLERNTNHLKRISESSLPARAIMLIRNGVSGLDYGVQPNHTVPLDAHKEFGTQTDAIKRVVENPNPEDDDFYTFMGQIVEDLLCFDAGVWEYVPRPDFIPRNDILGLFPVPGHTIAKNMKWDGNPDSIRWQQTIGKEPFFKDSEIEYMMQRKRSFSPFGYSPLEVVVEIMDAWLGLVSYQRSVASNAYPRTMLYLGEDVTREQARIMKTYWAMELEGKGRVGIWGNTGKPEVLDLKPTSDQGLYIIYQEMLVRTLAYSFGLKPQDFGLERDVNRSTSIVSQIASIEEARKPIARLIAAKINTRVIPRISTITGDEKIGLMEFFWIGIDPRQKKIDSEINDVYLKWDVKAVDDVRKELDLPPLPGGLGRFPPSVIKALAKAQPEFIISILTGTDITQTIENLRQVTTEPGQLAASMLKGIVSK